MSRQPLQVLVLATIVSALGQTATRADEAEIPRALFNYVQREEPDFAWELSNRHKIEKGMIYELSLTSQRWQDIVWKHNLLVFEPEQVRHPRHVLLFVTGGSSGNRPGLTDLQRGMALANLCGARVATLHQVPNQPLFDGRVEDNLITDTWLRYLETGDESWPLLFPMVKSAVKAMDAVGELAQQEWNTPLEGFMITGASKRGWTSWLTPVVDQRIMATAPLVIDVLNFRPQMKHQLATWGEYSEQIVDYTSKGLIVEGDESVRETHLRRMMDPYTYRKQLGLPKLLVNGTNDRYWVVDAMSLYWDDLIGPKYVLQVPNAGHGLDGGHDLVLSTVAAFFQHCATATRLPELTWARKADGRTITLTVTSSSPPDSARLWVSHSETKDFRNAKWASQPVAVEANTFVAEVPMPDGGHVAHFGELQFQIGGLPYSLCTLIQRD